MDPSEEEWRALIDDAEMACLTVTEQRTLAAAAAGYAAFAAAAAHAAFYLDTALAHLDRVLAEAPDAAAYAEFAAWYAPNVRSMDIIDDVAGAVASYGDPPYAYANRPYPFVGDDPAVPARCANYYRWRAWRLVKHLSQLPGPEGPGLQAE